MIAGYCRDLSFDVRYRPFAEGVLWNDNRAVIATLKGVLWLESPTVTIQFRDNRELTSLNWTFDRWNQNEAKTLGTDGNLPWDASEYRVDVTFPETGYKFSSQLLKTGQ